MQRKATTLDNGESHSDIFSGILGKNHETIQFHSIRVALLAEEFGLACNLSPDDMLQLKMAAFFHDIGKTNIPNSILEKPGRLSKSEWKIMMQHSEQGQRIVYNLDAPYCKEVSLYIRHHHEHWDGTGYPDKLCGNDIPIISRMVSLVDSYDAITETRSYRNMYRHDEALDIMRTEAGNKFDSSISEIFFDIVTSLTATGQL